MNRQIVYMDVSNLLEQDFLTGIQRVVREVALRLCRHPRLEIRFLCLDAHTQQFFTISDDDFRRALTSRPHKPFRRCPVSLSLLGPGSIFYDIDAVWGSQPHRAWLYPALKKQGLQIVTFVHDIIPITDPQYCYPNTVCQFMNYAGAVLKHADAIFVSTQATLQEIRNLQKQLKSPEIPLYITGLGADFSDPAHGTVADDVVQKLKDHPYVLLVSTLEPRKNHALLLDAFDQGLYDEGLCLVFAGRFGWGVDDLKQRLQSHPQFGRQLFHFSGLNDATINHLYRHAFLTAYPSFNEGFGLPIIESLERGTPAIVSDREVLKEVGKDFCLYCDPRSPTEWADQFRKLLHDPAQLNHLREQLSAFSAPTWDEATDRMAGYLLQLRR